MSLINEALKKAQRQRIEGSGTPLPASPAASAAPIVKRRPPPSANTLVTLVLGGLAVLILGGILSYVFLAPDDSAPEPARTTPITAKPAHTAPSPSPQVAPPATGDEIPTVMVKLPAIPSTPSPAPVPDPPKPPAAKPAPAANPRVHQLLDTLRVSGIRLSDTDPKAIVNDRLYRLNDIVDHGTQLRLFRVESSALIFIDAGGFEYRKSL